MVSLDVGAKKSTTDRMFSRTDRERDPRKVTVMLHPLLWLTGWLERLAAGLVPLDFQLDVDAEDLLDDLRFGR